MTSPLQPLARWCVENPAATITTELREDGWYIVARVGNSLTLWRECLAVPVPSGATPEEQRDLEEQAEILAIILRDPHLRRNVGHEVKL